jgi:integrase/recombinase XerD
MLEKSAPTVEAYRYDIGRFLEFLMEKKVRRAGHIKASHVVQYLGFCKQGGSADASINRYYMAIRNYCNFLMRTGAIEKEFCRDVPVPKLSVVAPRIPTREEVMRILAQPDVTTELGCRDKAILELLYSSGLRSSEICDLELHHLTQDSVTVLCGKRGKTRTVPITTAAYDSIMAYVLNFRGRQKGYLFVTIMGKQMRRQKLCAIVEKYATNAGVEAVTTHTLRHTCATHLLDQGAGLRFIQEILGHKSIASTERYTHLSSESMKSMFKTFHPRQEVAHG